MRPRNPNAALLERLAGHAATTPESLADLVLGAIADLMKDGKSVTIPGVGHLRTKPKRRWIRVGPDRGKAIEERVVVLQHGAVVGQGEPYEAA